MGNMRLGFEQAGHECVYSVEWDKHKRKIYEVIFGHEPEGNDITAVRASDLPAADCWTFGAPCQDFSIAGQRAGLDGERSSLVREVFRLVRETAEEHQPEWLLYENVKGMLSSNKGLDFLEILCEMDELGFDCEWQIFNSKDWGVPQNRERVYTLGHLRGRGSRKVFPIGESDELSDQGGTERAGQNQYSSCLTKNYAKGVHNQGETYIKQVGNIMPTSTRDNPNQGRVYDPSGIAPGLNKMEGGGRQPFIALQENTTKGYVEAVAGDGIRLAHMTSKTARARVVKQNSHTLDCDSHAGVLDNDMRIRRLTPRECMRLQGVPDYISDKLISAGISDTQIYRAAGDAVSVPVVYEIARRIT